MGFAMALGAIFAYPSDIPSSIQHKKRHFSYSFSSGTPFTG
jgi:hypothetical protein